MDHNQLFKSNNSSNNNNNNNHNHNTSNIITASIDATSYNVSTEITNSTVDGHYRDHYYPNDGDGDVEHDNHKWVLVVNNDIAFYPQTLKQIATTMYKHYESSTSLPKSSTSHSLSSSSLRYGIGFTNLCCGSEWSAVIFTKQLVEKVMILSLNDHTYGFVVYFIL